MTDGSTEQLVFYKLLLGVMLGGGFFNIYIYIYCIFVCLLQSGVNCFCTRKKTPLGQFRCRGLIYIERQV